MVRTRYILLLFLGLLLLVSMSSVFGFVDIDLLVTQDDASYYHRVWSDGSYVYVVNQTYGLMAYSWNGSGYTFLDNISNVSVGKNSYYRAVCGDGSYVYAACDDAGVRAFSFDGSVFTHLDVSDDGQDYYDVYADGSYVYVTARSSGLFVYSFNGSSFTLIDSDKQSGEDYMGVWVDSDGYIFVAARSDGIRAYSFDGVTLTHIKKQDDGSFFYDVWGNDSYVFVGTLDGGGEVFCYSFNGSAFSQLGKASGFGSEVVQIYADEDYVYAGFLYDGFRVLQYRNSDVRELGVVAPPVSNGCYGIWSDGDYIHTSWNSEGLRGYSLYSDIFVDVNTTTSVNTTSAFLHGYLRSSGSVSGVGDAGFWVHTNSSVSSSYNVQNISAVSGVSDPYFFGSSVTSLSQGQIYFVKSWFNNSNDFNSSNDVDVFLCEPEAPTGISTTVVNSSAINISWTAGTGANNTVIVRKTTGFPSSISDGTVVGNTSDSYYVVSGLNSGDVFYYRLWSYSSWVTADSSVYSSISSNYTDVNWAVLTVNVFDEATGNALSNWNITVTNNDGSQVYNSSKNNNPLSINTSLLPTGSVDVLVNKSGYMDRIYHLSISSNSFYSLNAYIPEKLISNLYTIRIINEYDEEIDAAFVRILEFDNESGVYQNVSSGYTDGNGEIQVNLRASAWYKLNISKSGFKSLSVSEYRPDPVYYGIYYPKTFKLYFEDEDYPDEISYHSVIVFNASRSGNTLTVFFSDSSLSTTNTTVYVWEINGSTGNRTLVGSDFRSGNNDFSVSFSVNGSNDIQVVLFLNHSVFGFIADVFFVSGDDKTFIDENWFDNLLDANYGTNPLGWSNTIAFFFMIMGLFSGDGYNAGVVMIMTGGLLLFVNSVIGLAVIGVAVPILMIVMGILVQWSISRSVGS